MVELLILSIFALISFVFYMHYIFWADLIGSHSARFLLVKVANDIGVDSNRFDFVIFWLAILEGEEGVGSSECEAAADEEASGGNLLLHFEGLDYPYAVVGVELVQ